MGIRDWPEDERPRERLRRHGAGSLSAAELLALFLRTGTRGRSAVDLARDLLARFDGDLARLASAPAAELEKVPGIGPAKAAQLVAALELARRALAGIVRERPLFEQPQAVRDWLKLEIGALPHEVFGVLWLDAAHRLIAWDELARGTLTQATVHPREVVRQALARNAAAAILAHNHPSGRPEASAADRTLTGELQKALALVDVRVLDHFVVAHGAPPLSFAEHGLL